MSKEDESDKNWKYSGDESEWDSFDRRMIRYMRKKYDVFGERLWLGTVEIVSDDFSTRPQISSSILSSVAFPSVSPRTSVHLAPFPLDSPLASHCGTWHRTTKPTPPKGLGRRRPHRSFPRPFQWRMRVFTHYPPPELYPRCPHVFPHFVCLHLCLPIRQSFLRLPLPPPHSSHFR
jgi:hypothetical protein